MAGKPAQDVWTCTHQKGHKGFSPCIALSNPHEDHAQSERAQFRAQAQQAGQGHPGRHPSFRVRDRVRSRPPCRPAYLALHRSGELLERARRMWSMMGKCRLCPRECGANRLQGKRGFCGTTGTTLTVSSFHPHFGEERPLVGTNGSGTIFFALQPALCLLSELGNQHAGLWR